MYRVGHNQKHLADEFMANPFGRASPELQRILMVFRGGPASPHAFFERPRPKSADAGPVKPSERNYA